VPYIDISARFALDHGLHVIVEGILHSEIYGAMLARLRSDHQGVTRSYCYELELDETLRRHRTKPLADEVTEETVASWYRSADRVPDLDEAVLGAGLSPSDALERVLADVGWDRREVASRGSGAGGHRGELWPSVTELGGVPLQRVGPASPRHSTIS
jgi:hypothetical protein